MGSGFSLNPQVKYVSTSEATVRPASHKKGASKLEVKSVVVASDSMVVASDSKTTPHTAVSVVTKGTAKILIIDVDSAVLKALAPCGEVNAQPRMTEDEIAACIGEYDALLCRSSVVITKRILDAATKLKVISLSQAGTDNVPISLCVERCIRVCNSPVGNTITTAEHTIALILSMVRHIPAADASIRRGTWDRGRFLGNQLHGNVLGLLGLGNIAFHVAKVLHAMGMQVMAYDPYGDQARADILQAKLVRTRDELAEVFQSAMVLSVHVPLTPETRGMVGREQITMMKPGSYIANCARGGIVDEMALGEALQSGHLAGAAVDVFQHERTYVDTQTVPKDFTLVQTPGCVLTPHLGAMTEEAQAAVAMDAGLQVERLLCKGIEPQFAVTKPDSDNPGRFIDARPAWMRERAPPKS